MIETVPSGTILNGRYRIERVLGSGGFGHVYLAIELATGQHYAVKEYLVTGPSGQEQLKHEANVLSQLHHPNLPAFHDAFNARGRYYVVLNYIEGSDLTDIIRMAQRHNEVIPIAQIMNWILATCDAVFFLHSQHPPVIHRDIKPDNIRVMSNGTAILVDLGNAKAAADGARTLFFIRHQGTPGYAPPEQYPGGGGTNITSDIYAIGGTLYFALTATEPPSVSTRNQSLQQGRSDLPSLQDKLASNPPVESSEANAARQFRLGVTKPSKPAPRHSRHLAQLGTLSPEVLSRLNSIIHKSMAMKPRDRYQYVADFAYDLRQVVAALPTAQNTTTSPVNQPYSPYTTQPDLPELYEAIQNAKANQDNQSTPDTSIAQPDTATTCRCPVCGASVRQQATFCPRCGTQLGNASQSTMRPTNVSNAASPVAHNVSQAVQHDADRTFVMAPHLPASQQQQDAFASSLPPLTPPLSHTESPNTQPSVNGSSVVPSIQVTSLSQNKQSTSSSPQRQLLKASGLRLGVGIVFVVIILVVLIIIMVFLLSSHGAASLIPSRTISTGYEYYINF